MHFELCAAGFSINNGKPNQRAACAAVLTGIDGGLVKYREIAWPVGAVTGNRAELLGAYLALAAVRPEHRRGSSVRLLVRSNYTTDLLRRSADGQYVSQPKKNCALVDRIRRLGEEFVELEVLREETPASRRADELSRTVAQQQSRVDSGTNTLGDGKDDRPAVEHRAPGVVGGGAAGAVRPQGVEPARGVQDAGKKVGVRPAEGYTEAAAVAPSRDPGHR